MDMLDEYTPKGNTIKNTVYLLIVLTIILLAGLILFFVSISVYWQKGASSAGDVPVTADSALMARAVQSMFLMEEDELLAGGLVGETAVPAMITPPSITPLSSATPTPDLLGTLIIPKIEVNHPIIPIYIRDGQWDIGEIGNQIGHLESTGQNPHDQLAMTFTAHVTLPWPEIAGPFADLIFLEHGDEIIYRWNGTDYIYQVERIFRADPQSVDLLYNDDGDKLLLVTCSGWDFSGREYAKRLVTRAVLVREEPIGQYGQ
jgi:LPXTG-site transpeptidase (sortase) family protein